MALLAGLLLGGIFTAKGQENPDSTGQSELFHGSHLPGDREMGRRLLLADELIAERRYSDAVRFLDDILAAEEDFFDSDGESLKRMALDRLLSLPAGGQRTYALLLQSQRDRALGSASRMQMAELAARFPPELLGAPVWRAWAEAQSEQGHYAHAAQLFGTIVSATEGEEGKQATSANDSLSLAIQLARTGQEDAALETLEKTNHANETIEQLLKTTRKAQQQWSATRSPQAWLGAEGDAMRNPQVPGEAPLAWRRWRAPLVKNAGDAPRLARRTESIAQAPRLAAQNVVAVEGKLIASTAGQLIAVDAETGKRLWVASRLAPIDSGGVAGDSSEAAILDSAVERAWLNRVEGGISSDGRCVFAVGGSAPNVSPERYRSRWGLHGQESPRTNALKAYEIASQGKLAWRLDGAEKEGQVAGAFFLGPPVADEGRLMALAQIDQTICFLLIDAATGEVAWRQSLVTLEREVEDNELLRLIGAVPTVADDLVICPTGVGVVVAVDPDRRTLAWAHRFPVEAERLKNVRRHDWRRFSSDSDLAWRQKPGWRETRVISAGELLLVTSPESDQLHCLNLETGNEIGSIKIATGLALGAVTPLPQGDMAIVIEAKAISAWDVPSGKPFWRIATPPSDLPAGAGLLVGDHFLLPLSSGRLAVVPLTRERPVMKWVDLGPDPFDTPAEGGALAYHRGAIYVRTSTALARYDQPPQKNIPSDSERKARLAASRVREAQKDLTTVPSAAEQLTELVKDLAGRRQIAILQIEAAVERRDSHAAIAAAYQLAKLNPTETVVEGPSGERVAADRWASARLARLEEKGGEEQLLLRYEEGELDLETIETLLGMFDFMPRWGDQVLQGLNAEQRQALADRLVLWNPQESQPPVAKTSDIWATHQVIAALSVLETPAETRRRSPVFRHRQTPKENQRIHFRRAGLRPLDLGEAVPYEWRLVGQPSEARELLGANAEGERLTSLRLPEAMNALVHQQGVSRPSHWQSGPYLILNIEGQVSVYDVRVGIATEERLCWTTGAVRFPPRQVILLRGERGTPAPLTKAGPPQILWVGPKGVVLQHGNQLECRDLLNGRPLWQRSFSPIEQTVGNDRQLYVVTSNRSGKVLSLVDGSTLSKWQPPRGEWQVAQGTRLLVTHENETRIFDFSIDSKSPVWHQSLTPGTLFTRVDDHRFATLDPEGELSLFDLQATSLEGGPQFKIPLKNATKPKSLHAYGLGVRLLVVVNEIGAEEHRSQGRFSLSAEPLVTGKAYCLDPGTGVSLWQSPASLEGEALLPATIADSPAVFFGSRQTIPGVSDVAATQNRLVAIDLATGRTLYRNDSLPTGGEVNFWVQRESAPSPRLLVSLGAARLRLDLTTVPSSPSPPYHAVVERHDSSNGSSLSGIGRDLGRLFQSMITPDPENDDEK